MLLCALVYGRTLGTGREAALGDTGLEPAEHTSLVGVCTLSDEHASRALALVGDLVCLGGLPGGGDIETIGVGIGAGEVSM